MHPLVRLAKAAIELYVKDGTVLAIAAGDTIAEMQTRAGVFVSLKIRGMLRGCIGTFQPCEPDVAREIVRNAISAASCDPRFPPVRPDELEHLEYSVDVLTDPERIAVIEDLDPKRYGVIVQAGSRRGLLLPDLDGVDTAQQQVDIARQKACIPAGTPVTLYRFEVKRYH